MPVSSIQEILYDISKGRMVVLVDDMFRENEGDLVVAADYITPEAINFMASYGKGLVCLPASANLCDRLDFYPMVPSSPLGLTAFTVTIDAADGITTGVSAIDRAVTVSKVVHPDASPEDFRRPGHMMPLRANKGGVLVRSGHTEASVDLCCAAGLSAAAVICEILNEDGSMARMPDLDKFSVRHGIKIGLVEDLVNYRLNKEKLFSFNSDFYLDAYWHVREYKDAIDDCSWCLVYPNSFSSKDRGVLSLDSSFMGDLDLSGRSLSDVLKDAVGSSFSSYRGKYGVFRVIDGSSSISFRNLMNMSSVSLMFKRTSSALSFIADDLSISFKDLSFDSWKVCFEL